ncbi:glycosyl-4,4'-diaponeurosporenoate acyltransferase CrtO family protein [Emticicia soli]|uniref:Glycosyl-4,4'-diaponeurosporenoate acyltransferase n=1 Tax=Emticicia soli TaxID=2027878 RepID=A0ABW5JAB8_9BACT
MIIKYFTFSVSITIISWIVGMIVTAILARTPSYKNLSSLNFIPGASANKLIGIDAFRWIVKNTFFRFFNPKLKIKGRIETAQMLELRKEMTFSEISHFAGFGFVAVFAVVKFINAEFLFGMIMMLINVLMNLYPSLLQQENKRRIDKFLMRFS